MTETDEDLSIYETIEERYAKLEKLRELEPGWDSYSAPKVESKAIGNAKAFVRAVNCYGFKLRLKPSVVGGVGATIRVDNRKAYIEFSNAGQVTVLYSATDQEPWTESVVPKRQSFVDLAVRLHYWLRFGTKEG